MVTYRWFLAALALAAAPGAEAASLYTLPEVQVTAARSEEQA